MPSSPTPGSPSHCAITDYDEFVKVHGILLANSGIPRSLHRRLFDKLTHSTFDGGNHFSIEPCEGGRQRRLLLRSDSMGKESDVFLVDHAWTFRLPDAIKMLKEIPGLTERMAALMCVDLDIDEGEAEEEVEGDGRSYQSAWEIVEREMEKAKVREAHAPVWLELEQLGINDEIFHSLNLADKFPNLIALNLWGNVLQNPELVVNEIIKCKNLKALWLNDNPVLQNRDVNVADAILEGLPALEILNACFTKNFSDWALGFCGGLYGIDNPYSSSNASLSLKGIRTLDLSDRCIHKLDSTILSPAKIPSLSHLNLKGNPLDQNFEDDLLEILKGFEHLEFLEVDIPGAFGDSALRILHNLPKLSLLNGIPRSHIIESGKHVIDSFLQPRLPECSPNESLVDRVVDAMWLYLMTYRLADEEKIDETSVWYVMDELGSALRHSDEPNFRVAPFLFMPEGKLISSISYSVLWPVQNVSKGEECTRDFLFGIGEEKQRSARLMAWFHTPENYFIQAFKKYCEQVSLSKILPSARNEAHTVKSILPTDGRRLYVYTDIPQVEENLTRAEFVLTNEPKDADIIWTSQQIDSEVKDAVGLKDSQYINQFPFEACLVMKHHLAETTHKAQGFPEWLQPTYNLETHLSAFIGDYHIRQNEGQDNLWILKPWNMARTIDTSITGNLSAVVRLMETGPKICQKYIEQPALFKGRKFDLRYIVLVRSMRPVEIFLSDVFWVRLANNPYILEKNSLFEYETHFTVMNYIGRLNHMHTPDFVREFEEEHQEKWLNIHERIRCMIRSVFDSAAAVHPDMHSPMSRSMYGVDVMLDRSFKPKLLEVTYCPDCTRACKYDTQAIVGHGNILRGQDFFNTVFGCLFFNETAHVTPL